MTGSLKTSSRPTVIKWQGVRMMRTHSIMPAIQEIIQISRNLNVVKIGLIGEPSTGKGNLAQTLAHLIHLESKKQHYLDWQFRRLGKDQFMDPAYIKNMPYANYILHFQDLSFLYHDKKNLDAVKNMTTEIRHRDDGRHVNIILIYDYHYTKGLDKYLRQSNFKFFTGVGSSEYENMQEMFGKRNWGRIKEFNDKFTNAILRGTYTFKLGKKGRFKYNYKNPFIVCLLWNNKRLRYVATPTREWIHPHCTICSEGIGDTKTTLAAEDFVNMGKKKWGQAFDTAWKIEDSTIGIDTWAQRVVDARHWLGKMLVENQINREKVRTVLGTEYKTAKAVVNEKKKEAKKLNMDPKTTSSSKHTSTKDDSGTSRGQREMVAVNRRKKAKETEQGDAEHG